MHFHHYRVEVSFVMMSGSFGQITLMAVVCFLIEKCELLLRMEQRELDFRIERRELYIGIEKN